MLDLRLLLAAATSRDFLICNGLSDIIFVFVLLWLTAFSFKRMNLSAPSFQFLLRIFAHVLL